MMNFRRKAEREHAADYINALEAHLARLREALLSTCQREAETQRRHDAKLAALTLSPIAVDDCAGADPVVKAADPVAEAARVDIAEIERSGRRWHGEDQRIVSVRWEPYKPDGQRQMKAKGRWQECEGIGDFHRWSNMIGRPENIRAIGEASHDPI